MAPSSPLPPILRHDCRLSAAEYRPRATLGAVAREGIFTSASVLKLGTAGRNQQMSVRQRRWRGGAMWAGTVPLAATGRDVPREAIPRGCGTYKTRNCDSSMDLQLNPFHKITLRNHGRRRVSPWPRKQPLQPTILARAHAPQSRGRACTEIESFGNVDVAAMSTFKGDDTVCAGKIDEQVRSPVPRATLEPVALRSSAP